MRLALQTATVAERSTLPGAPEADDEDAIVLHVDLDCFYAACERLREPELEGEPLVVGMGYEPGDSVGAVATASYEAREFGVESAQAITTALERLPRADEPPTADAPGGANKPTDDSVGYYRPVDMEYYESVAEDIKAILHDCADVVREVSIDEAYLDVTDRTAWEVAEGYARHVKERIDREVGLTASVGVAPTMHAAKVASDHDKPDGLVVVEPGEIRPFLAPLPVAELHGIGPVTAGDLRDRGIETVDDLAAADREWLADEYGSRGRELHDRAHGIDDREVEPRGRPKSLSRESAFAEPQDDHGAVRERIRALAAAVADRARSKGAMYRTIGIKVVTPPYDVNTRARSLPGPVDDPDLVGEVALDLLEEFGDATPRKVGVRVSNLSFADADQSTLGGWEPPGDDGASAASGDEGGNGTTTPKSDGHPEAPTEPGADGQVSLAADWPGERGGDELLDQGDEEAADYGDEEPADHDDDGLPGYGGDDATSVVDNADEGQVTLATDWPTNGSTVDDTQIGDATTANRSTGARTESGADWDDELDDAGDGNDARPLPPGQTTLNRFR